ncbi:hypothetical protein [Laribacter hongkongensis]|uniref:Uncharacterized protein n=1 Tax=Laribacter hongkongensis TaxID=168471 RepID=A0ABD4SLB1_9NEIS|nr:hypothetical protein [Laribacter hongkongensis]MCG9024500.1 hypothetical protein [Laribacter hongkongensis]
MQTTIYSAMSMLTSATSIKHILDDDAEEFSCGQVHYALELDGRLFLVWNDMDSGSMIVSPIERWSLTNLMEAIDDPMPVLTVTRLSAQASTFVVG